MRSRASRWQHPVQSEGDVRPKDSAVPAQRATGQRFQHHPFRSVVEDFLAHRGLLYASDEFHRTPAFGTGSVIDAEDWSGTSGLCPTAAARPSRLTARFGPTCDPETPSVAMDGRSRQSALGQSYMRSDFKPPTLDDGLLPTSG